MEVLDLEKYMDCYVAFMDILGFKEIINKRSFEEIEHVFNSIKEFEPAPLLKDLDVYRHIDYYIMSDSIVVYVNSGLTGAFIALTDVCNQIQIRLAALDSPVLLRGGISRGELYCNENVIFGPGLTEAYLLESSLAKYPRVIFTEKIRTEALENAGKLYAFDFNNMYYCKDDDMLYYINYLHTFGNARNVKVLSDEI